jgi:hypothetical protein
LDGRLLIEPYGHSVWVEGKGRGMVALV